jgi:chaperonin GroES
VSELPEYGDPDRVLSVLMKTFGNRILVEKKRVERVRASGLIVPETKDERAQEGTIISVGPRVNNVHLRAGAHVYFGKWSADGVNEGLDILCLREQDVLGVRDENGISPIKRILVEMISIGEDHRTNLGPTLRTMGIVIEDKKKHWDHQYRRGRVVAIDPDIKAGVCVGDVVVFNGAAGFTLDGDVMDEGDKYDEPLKGESFRWLKAKELDAIEEPMYA